MVTWGGVEIFADDIEQFTETLEQVSRFFSVLPSTFVDLIAIRRLG